MTSITPTINEQKLTRVYSDRRGQEVLYRVQYDLRETEGCKIYTIQRLEELE